MQSGRIQRLSATFRVSALLLLPALLTLAGCASYAGRELTVGTSTVPAVIAEMGEPAMRWQDADGSLMLAYPRGPEGPHTFVAAFGPDGRLRSIENVLVERYFARIVPGATEDEVVRLIGPAPEHWKTYFAARNERVWDWRYCDGGDHLAMFSVVFDAATNRVRSTASRPDYRGPDGGVPPCGQVPGR